MGLSKNEPVGRTARELFPKTGQFWIDAFGRVALGVSSESILGHSAQFDRWYEARIYSPHPGEFAALFIDIHDVSNRCQDKVKN